MKILVVDDDKVNLKILDLLARAHGETVCATNGEEAVDLFFETGPDLLLLDLAMPKKDGLTVLKEIMEKDSTAKVVLITASDDQKIINQCSIFNVQFTFPLTFRTSKTLLGNHRPHLTSNCFHSCTSTLITLIIHFLSI